jgi:hypothetical protein
MSKIRPHIIRELEKGNTSILPDIYIKSFIKTLCKELNINESQFEKVKDSTGSKPENTKAQEIDTPDIPEKPAKPQTDYTELFKKSKQYTPSKKSNLVYFLIYSGIGLAVVVAIYFIFFYTGSSNGSRDVSSNMPIDSVISELPKKSILSRFEEPDSLVLTVRAVEETWVRVRMDGERSEEILLQPNQSKKWKASEFILVDQGNVGGAEFFRNGEILDIFGSRGSVVKNIKITKNEVIKPTPWRPENDQTSPQQDAAAPANTPENEEGGN